MLKFYYQKQVSPSTIPVILMQKIWIPIFFVKKTKTKTKILGEDLYGTRVNN